MLPAAGRAEGWRRSPQIWLAFGLGFAVCEVRLPAILGKGAAGEGKGVLPQLHIVQLQGAVAGKQQCAQQAAAAAQIA